MPEHSALIVSRADESDLDRLAAIYFAAYAMRGRPCAEKDLYRRRAALEREFRDEKTIILKVSVAENILGFLSYQQPTAAHVTLQRFYTLPSDKKPGSALMRPFLDAMAAQNVKTISLISAGKEATQVYEHYGFRRTKTANRLEKTLP